MGLLGGKNGVAESKARVRKPPKKAWQVGDSHDCALADGYFSFELSQELEERGSLSVHTTPMAPAIPVEATFKHF